LEVRLSAENDRRERQRNASEIEEITKRVEDHYLTLAPAIAEICGATEMAAAIVPEAREFNDSLTMIAAEITKAIDGLLDDNEGLFQCSVNQAQHIEGLVAVPVQPQPGATLLCAGASLSPEELLNSDDCRLPDWLPRRKPPKRAAGLTAAWKSDGYRGFLSAVTLAPVAWATQTFR
jgi:hypothetical protein